MGEMMRRYWIPAAFSVDLVADGLPRRLRLLGEDFVAFRDTNGRVGILDENCPHRGASLVLARNEACGLRCLYHGWKIAADGTILETPPEPEELGFRDKIRARAFPTYEGGGFVWTYLGPPGTEPPRFTIPLAALPHEHVVTIAAHDACNWLQAIEGGLDSAHSNYLHTNAIKPLAGPDQTLYKKDANFDRPSNDGAPRIEVADEPYGFRYAAIRKPLLDADRLAYIRVSQFIAPFYAITPAPANWIFMLIIVPIDDENCMFYFPQANEAAPLDGEERATHLRAGGLLAGVDVDADYRKRRTPANNWLQDRAAMRRGHFTGIDGISMEDIAVQESMGPIYDRRKEHLGTSDVAIIRLRRRLLDAVRAFTERGEAPLGLGAPIVYDRIRAEERMIPLGSSWQTCVIPSGVEGQR
jgi:phthalate 4,5-dioxygenase oxygenase subunit